MMIRSWILSVCLLNQGAWTVQTSYWTVQQFLKRSFINSNSQTSPQTSIHPLNCPKNSNFKISSQSNQTSTRTAENFRKQLKMVSKVPNSQIHTSQIFQLFLKCSNISLNVSISPQKAQTLLPLLNLPTSPQSSNILILRWRNISSINHADPLFHLDHAKSNVYFI